MDIAQRLLRASLLCWVFCAMGCGEDKPDSSSDRKTERDEPEKSSPSEKDQKTTLTVPPDKLEAPRDSEGVEEQSQSGEVGESATPEADTEGEEALDSLSLFSAEALHDYSKVQSITWYVEGGALAEKPTLLLSQSRFVKIRDKTVPQPATMILLSQTDDGWDSQEVTDEEAAVFHKAIIHEDGHVYTITGGDPNKPEQLAYFKRWSANERGELDTSETLWTGQWAGKRQRLRDFEIGDVDGDGADEVVIATHDQGVIVVLDNVFSAEKIIAQELDMKENTFVHEIELGDLNGDGIMEFFATPSDPNKATSTQPGDVVMYTHSDGDYTRHLVDHTETTHAKEILAADMDGDGISELFSAVEAQKLSGKFLTDVEIRQFQFNGLEPAGHQVIATLPGQQLRFMMAHDFDGDGRKELIVAPMKTGLYYLSSRDGQTYDVHHFFEESGGFEHAANLIDLDQDGTPELYVADDSMSKSLRRFTWNSAD